MRDAICRKLSRARGVVVGVQDIGFDLTHPTFYTRDMSRYRIQALWDHLSPDTIGSPYYVGRDYRGEEALLQLGCPYDGNVQTHGTHTAGIAAGSGFDSPLRWHCPRRRPLLGMQCDGRRRSHHRHVAHL